MANKSSSLRSFRHRNYRIFYPAVFISNVGTWAQRVAQDWLVVTDLHKGGAELGIVTGLQFLPTLFVSLYGGILADRFSKRKLLMITNGGGAITALIMGYLIISNRVTINEVFILAFVLGLFSAIDSPVGQSFTPEIVGKEDTRNAISLNSANFNAARLVGPAVSGLLIKAFGTGPSFILNAISFAIITITLTFIRDHELQRNAPSQEKPRISEAITYVRSRPDITALLFTVFITATFGLNFQIFNALMATKVFDKDAGAFGGLGSAIAVGTLAAGILSARSEQRRRPKFIMFTSALFGLTLIAISTMPTFLAYALFLPICGVIAVGTMIQANSYVSITTPSALRGRVMGIYLLVFLGGSPIGSPLIGVVSDAIGVRQAIAICGEVVSFGAGITFVLARKKLAAFDQDQKRNAN